MSVCGGREGLGAPHKTCALERIFRVVHETASISRTMVNKGSCAAVNARHK